MRLTRPPVMVSGPVSTSVTSKILLLVQAVVLDRRLCIQGDGEIVVHGLVVEEVLLDHVAAIAQAENEVAEVVMGEESS